MAAIEIGTVRGSRRRERDFTAEENETTATVTVKRRKEVESRIILSPCVQATSRGGIVARNSAGASESNVVIVRRRDSPVVDDQIRSSGDEDLDPDSSVTCNNRSQEKSKRKIEFVDFEENNNGGEDEIETSWFYDNLFNKRNNPYSEESGSYMEIQASEDDVDVESRRRLRMMKKKKKKKSRETVKEDELEDFFQTAEKDLRNKMLECSRKYNFDFQKEEPLGGRFEWVKLNP